MIRLAIFAFVLGALLPSAAVATHDRYGYDCYNGHYSGNYRDHHGYGNYRDYGRYYGGYYQYHGGYHSYYGGHYYGY